MDAMRWLGAAGALLGLAAWGYMLVNGRGGGWPGLVAVVIAGVSGLLALPRPAEPEALPAVRRGPADH